MLSVNQRPVYGEDKYGVIHAVDGAFMHNHNQPTTWTLCGFDISNCFTRKTLEASHTRSEIKCDTCKRELEQQDDR